MTDLWLPPPPPCASIMQAADSLTIRTTPSPTGRNVGSILAGAVVRVDRRDTCLLYGAKWRYARLLSAVGVQVREPLYIALEETTSAGTVPLLRLVRDECDDVPAPVEPEEPLPEYPEEITMDYIELELKKVEASLVFLKNKLGVDPLKAVMPAGLAALVSELALGQVTEPEPEEPPVDPPVEEEPEAPPPPPVEEWPPAEEEPEPEPETPPVVEPPVPEAQLTPFRVSNNQILKDDQLWKGLGINFRELAFYGLGLDPIKWATDEHFFQQLQGAVDYEAKVIRVYCAHPALSVEQAIPRVKRVLDEAQKRGLHVILCLTDGAPNGAFFVPEAPDMKQGRYTWKWILGGYRDGNYWRYVDKMTQALGSHGAIFAWEPINELTALTWPLTTMQADGMLDFWKRITALIRKNSPKKMISSGNVSSWELFVEQAYSNGKYALRMAKETDLNLVCFHSYADTPDKLGAAGEHIRNEIRLLKENGVKRVAFIIGETAGKWTPDFVETSSEPLRVLVEEALSMGVALIAWWAVSFPRGKDIGVHALGYPNADTEPLSTRWHNGMNLLKAKAKQLKEAYS